MKYALVNGNRTKATRGAEGTCPICDSEVRAYCGDIRIHHWKHKRKHDCDPWLEGETEWHLTWKGKYPDEWQETTMTDDQTGEKHIADVHTVHGLVLEFQHSRINPEERDSREKFYEEMVWVVDGTRLKGDYPRFLKGINDLRNTGKEGFYIVDFPDEIFPSYWLGSKVPVIFDFLGVDPIDNLDLLRNQLYCLLPARNSRRSILLVFTRESFIKSTIQGNWLAKQESPQNENTPPPMKNNDNNKRHKGSTHYLDPRKGRLVRRWRF